MGVEIQRNLRFSIPLENPAITAAEHNDKAMLLYWLRKQKEIFADDLEYVRQIFCAAMDMVSMMNEYDMLACVIADDELFGILGEIYSKVDNADSIRLYLSALRKIRAWITEKRTCGRY